MKIYSINTTNSYKSMDINYKRTMPVSFKASGDDNTQDTFTFQQDSQNNSFFSKAIETFKGILTSGTSQELYSDSELYGLMLASGSKL